MFAVLHIREKDKTVKGRLKEYLLKPEIRIEKILYKERVAFCRISTSLHKNEIPWDAIRKACPKNSQKFILPYGISEPESGVIKEYKSDKFETLMLFNTMLHYMKIVKPDPLSSSLCLFDPDGSIPHLITKALPCFCKINIITENKRAYGIICQSILDNYGLSVTVTSEICYNSKDTVLVCSKGEAVPLTFKGTVFCNRNVTAPGCFVIKSKNADIPENIKAIIPDNTDPFKLLSALYDLSEIKELQDMSYII